MSFNNTLRAKSVLQSLLLLVILTSPASLFAKDKAPKPAEPKAPKAQKLDKALQAVIDTWSDDTAPVLVTVLKGHENLVAIEIHEAGGDIQDIGRESITAIVPTEYLPILAYAPGVKALSVDADVKGHGTAPTMAEQPPVTPAVLRQVLGVSGASGKTVGVAIIDSGIANLPGFEKRIRAFYDFTKGGKAAAPSDEYGHGTHIATTIGGTLVKTPEGDFGGVAPNVAFIGLKVLDREGNGQTSNVIAALEFAIKQKAALGIDVINMSLGHPIYEPAATDPLVQAVEKAVAAGIVVVVSAGNTGLDDVTGDIVYGTIESPGNAPSAITVGASMTMSTLARGDDRIADYSSRGPTYLDEIAKPDLVAPGQRIVSQMQGGSTIFKENKTWKFTAPKEVKGEWVRLSGTSMSTGVVSAVASLVIDRNRSLRAADGRPMAPLTPYDIKAILQYTATPIADADVFSQGAGEVNAAGALSLVGALDTRYSPWLVGPLVQATTIGGETLAWSQMILWGAETASSDLPDEILAATQLAWATDGVWGDARKIVWGNAKKIVWGNAKKIVWGNQTMWGNKIVWGNETDNSSGNAKKIVWGNEGDSTSGNAKKIVWGNAKKIVWGNSLDGLDEIGARSCSISELCY